MKRIRVLLAGCLLFSKVLAASPLLFDTHLHYSIDDEKALSPEELIAHLNRNGVAFAAIAGTASGPMRELRRLAPERIVPLLSLYQVPLAKAVGAVIWELYQSCKKR